MPTIKNLLKNGVVLILALLLTLQFNLKNPVTSAQTTPTAGRADYTTQNGKILKNGQEIHLYGVSWFGFEDEGYSPHGLWKRNLTDMINQMKNLGFNSFRVPFCPGALQNKPTGYIDTAKNPGLKSLNSLDLMDKITGEMNAQQMYILLDHHNADCKQLTPLWYTPTYSEQQWISDVTFLANRYKNLDYFMGFDLKNEPREDTSSTPNTKNATWGVGDPLSDWNKAAEKAGKSVLSVNPNILMFVGGIGNKQTNCSDEWGAWWGGNFMPIRCTPIDPVSIPTNKLVLTPHVYGPDVYVAAEFNAADFPNNLPAGWDKYFGFAPSLGYAMAIGEFGGKYGHDDKFSKAHPKDITWQTKIIDYFIEKKQCNFFYWSLNPDSSDTGGIFQPDYINVWQDKVTNLQRLITACKANLATQVVPATPTPVVSTPTTPPVDPVSGNPNLIDQNNSILSDWSLKKFRGSKNGFKVTAPVKLKLPR
jgi:endoglucanase